MSHRLPLDVVHEFDELDELEDLVSEEFEVVPVGVGVSADFGKSTAEISSHDGTRQDKSKKGGPQNLRDVGLSSAAVHEREGADVRERALVVLVVHRPPVAERVVPSDDISGLEKVLTLQRPAGRVMDRLDAEFCYFLGSFEKSSDTHRTYSLLTQ